MRRSESPRAMRSTRSAGAARRSRYGRASRTRACSSSRSVIQVARALRGCAKWPDQSRQFRRGRAALGVLIPRLATAIGLVALCAIGIRYGNTTPAIVPAGDTANFSAERALEHVRQIAQRPHPPGTADHARVRAYLIAQLRAMGLDPQVQTTTGVGTRYAVAGRVHNVVTRIPGTS